MPVKYAALLGDQRIAQRQYLPFAIRLHTPAEEAEPPLVKSSCYAGAARLANAAAAAARASGAAGGSRSRHRQQWRRRAAAEFRGDSLREGGCGWALQRRGPRRRGSAVCADARGALHWILAHRGAASGGHQVRAWRRAPAAHVPRLHTLLSGTRVSTILRASARVYASESVYTSRFLEKGTTASCRLTWLLRDGHATALSFTQAAASVRGGRSFWLSRSSMVWRGAGAGERWQALGAAATRSVHRAANTVGGLSPTAAAVGRGPAAHGARRRV